MTYDVRLSINTFININKIFIACSMLKITEQKTWVRNCQGKGREKFYVHLMYRLRRPDRWITIIPVAGVVKYRDHACLEPILGRTCTHFRVHTWPRCSYTVYSCAQYDKDASSTTGICFSLLEFWNTEYVFRLSWKLPTLVGLPC